jgi:purine-binding chemotaxis protein CheW
MSELALVETRAVSDRDEEQLVTMSVEGQLFGLPILTVQDIVETHNITQVPRTPSAISGIMNLRGRIVTVINLRRILGRSDDHTSRMGVTVESHGDLYTILVDQIGEVRLLDRSNFETAPTTLDPKLKQLCTGIYRLDGELLAVLDVNAILSAEIISQTPPIQFIARRPKEAKDAKDAKKGGPKALPAPANEDAEEAVAEEEPGEEAKPKTGSKNIFRKQKSASSGKTDTKPAVNDDAEPTADAKKAEPAAKAADNAAPKAEPKTAAPAEPAPAPEAEEDDEQAPVTTATDVAPGAPATPSQSEDLLQLVGGEAALGNIVKNFFEKAAEHKLLAKHYEGADLASQAKAMQSFLIKALKGAGGGKKVSAPGHGWLSPRKGLDDEDFNACLALFEKALSAQSVPEGTIFRVLAAFERHRESVVD